MQGIFQDLKPPQHDKLDLLTEQKSYTVLAVEPQEQLLHLDSPLLQGGHSQWAHDGDSISTTVINEVVILMPASFLMAMFCSNTWSSLTLMSCINNLETYMVRREHR